MKGERGLTLIEVIISFAFAVIFISSLFTMIGFIHKTRSNNLKQFNISNILFNKMEEIKAELDTDINSSVKEHEQEYIVRVSIDEVYNIKDLYKVSIEIVDNSKQFKDVIISYYSNVIDYKPKTYNEIPINIEDVSNLTLRYSYD